MPQNHSSHTHLAMLAGAAFFAGEAGAANLITNGSFEPDATGWTGAGLIYSHPYNGISGIKLADTGGTQSVAATGNFNFDSLQYGYYDNIPLAIGSKFHGLSGGSQTITQTALTSAVSLSDIDSGRGAMCFSAWLTSWSGDGNTPAIRVRFFSGDNGTGTLLGTQTLDRGTTTNQIETAQHLATGNYLNGAEDSRTDPDYWALYEVKAGIPQATRSAIVDIIAGTGHVGSGGNDWYVDAVVLDVTTVPYYHWTGAAAGTEWSTAVQPSPKNWEVLPSPGTPTDYIDGVPVQFDDASTGVTVVLSNGNVAPTGISISGTTKSFTFSGAGSITGAAGLFKSGTTTLTISNANTLSGISNIAGGSLVLENTLALQNSTVLTTSGQSSLNFGTPTVFTIGGLSGSGSVSLQNGASQAVALTVGSGNGSSTTSGALSGPGSLTKTGTGTFGIQSASSYAGGTTLAGGWVSMGNAASLSTAPVVSTGGGILFAFGSGTTTEITNDLTLPAAGRQMFQATGNPAADVVVTLSGKVTGGTAGQIYRFVDTDTSGNHRVVLRLTNPANDFQGNMEMWRGNLEFTSDAALGNADNDIHHYTEGLAGTLRFGADNITLNANRTIQFYGNTAPMPIDTGAYTGTIAGNFTGIGNFIKLGAGRLILTGTNNATGITTITAGTMEVDGTFATGGGLVTVEPAGTLTGTGSIQRAITLQGTLAPGNGTGTLTSGGVLTVAGGSTLQVQVADWTGAAGTGYDQVTADSLAITATSGTPATLVVTPDSLANFSDTTRRFTIATGVNPATGFDAAAFLVNATAMPASTGTWGVELEGNNLVLVHALPPNGFAGWIAGKGLNGGDAAEDADPDNDGIENLVEFLFGTEPNPANPDAMSSASGPEISVVDGATLRFVFRQTEESVGFVTPTVEISGDLENWEPSGTYGPDVTTTVDPDGYEEGVNKVTVDIARSISPDKMFVRISAAVPAP